jgi:hypothetical protein
MFQYCFVFHLFNPLFMVYVYAKSFSSKAASLALNDLSLACALLGVRLVLYPACLSWYKVLSNWLSQTVALPFVSTSVL